MDTVYRALWVILASRVISTLSHALKSLLPTAATIQRIAEKGSRSG